MAEAVPAPAAPPAGPTAGLPPTPSSGLTDAEAASRRAAGLGNPAPPATSRTYVQILRENVFTFINNVIFVLGVMLVIVGRPLDALVSIGVIGTNIVVSVAQEVRAKRTLDRIALLTRPTATLVREGTERAVPPEDLVVGDLLRVGAGDQVVLDGHLVDGSLEADESQLTGESDLVPKRPGDPVYSGSFVVNGGGSFVVAAVGSASLANRITAGARTFRRVLTPLQSEINLVIRVALAVVVYLEIVLLLNNVLKLVGAGQTVGEAALLVGLVPNGLFVSIAIAYALGAVRIVRYGALVQQANAIESLSNVDVLCLDKTGTLTANRLVVDEVVSLAGSEEDLRATLGAVVASAAVRNKTAEAIAAACPAEALPLAADVPFSSARKWSAVAFAARAAEGAAGAAGAEGFRGAEGPRGVIAMGAAEYLRPSLAGMDDDDRRRCRLGRAAPAHRRLRFAGPARPGGGRAPGPGRADRRGRRGAAPRRDAGAGPRRAARRAAPGRRLHAGPLHRGRSDAQDHLGRRPGDRRGARPAGRPGTGDPLRLRARARGARRRDPGRRRRGDARCSGGSRRPRRSAWSTRCAAAATTSR